MNEYVGFVLLGVLLVACIVVMIIITIKSTAKMKQEKIASEEKKLAEKSYFTDHGCVISKCISNLLIDDVHKKWMVVGTEKIFNYSDVTDVKIIENGNQIEVGALSVHSTIKSITVSVSTADPLNALINIPVFETKGNLGLETSSYEYTNFKKIALEQEAFFNAVIAQSKPIN